MTKPKEERNKLFWIVATLAAVPAVCFFVFGIRVVDKAPWFMAGFTSLVAVFTFLLWWATKKYAETTEGLLEQSRQAVEQSRLLTKVTKEYTEATKELLEQSKEALEQSRISFLVDIVDRTIECAEKMPHPKVANQAKHIYNKSRAIKKIDRERSLEFLDAMIDWSVGELTKILKEYRKSL